MQRTDTVVILCERCSCISLEVTKKDLQPKGCRYLATKIWAGFEQLLSKTLINSFTPNCLELQGDQQCGYPG